MQDLNVLHKDSSKIHNTSFSTRDFDSDPRDYIKKAVNKYSGLTFLIEDEETKEKKEVYVPKETE